MVGTNLNLLVLKASDPAALAKFYSRFGLRFALEQHGRGPEHQACVMDNSVLEIYPLLDEGEKSIGVRLGFQVPSIDMATAGLDPASDFLLLPSDTKWGRRCVIRDPEGHKIELVERT
ncbi:MAG: glyoxalase [Parvibaculum sp.]|jgi:catechol 2,3-dioxygenase-like lactoylglutathione lyase family enzyme|nr:hypothetical protein [Nitrospira sp.]MBX3491549.1 glyoxalase [Parvibaculum sp.]